MERVCITICKIIKFKPLLKKLMSFDSGGVKMSYFVKPFFALNGRNHENV